MFKLLAVAAVSIVFMAAAHAETAVKLTDVHLCCNSCVKGANKAVGTVPGATAVCEADAGTIALTAPDDATAQKAVDALLAAGYFGKTESSAVKLADTSGAQDAKVSTLNVENVHLCCPKCVKAVNGAVSGVPGVAANTATKNAKTFEVTGDFNAKQVFTALQTAGLTGLAGK